MGGRLAHLLMKGEHGKGKRHHKRHGKNYRVHIAIISYIGHLQQFCYIYVTLSWLLLADEAGDMPVIGDGVMVRFGVDWTVMRSEPPSFDIELQAVILRTMSHHSFEMFCEMIDGLGPKEVLKAAAMERHMLNENLALGRTVPSEDSTLIRTFCRFLEGAAYGRLVLPRTMSMAHWTFYEKIVERLVAAGELPRKAQEDLEAANNAAFFRIMA